MAVTSKKKANKRITKKTAPKKAAGGKAAKKVNKKTAAPAKVTKKAKKKVVAKTTGKPTKKTTKTTAIKTTKKTAARKKVSVKKAVAKKKPVSRAKTPSGSGEFIHGIAPYKARSRERYMNLKQLDHFRNILATWRRELVDEVNRTIHSMQDETVNHPDPNDRATQESDISLELRSRDRERKLIKKIDGTIALIDSGDYGYCDKCGVEVGIARLEARPTANLCVDCKTLDEIREKQMV